MLSEPGKPAEIEFFREGRRLRSVAVMEDRNTSAALAQGGQRLDRTGLIVVPRELPLSRRGMAAGTVTGFLVAEVFPGSPAAESGFQVSDFILDIDGRTFDSASELATFVEQQALREPLRIGVIRGNERGAIYLRGE